MRAIQATLGLSSVMLLLLVELWGLRLVVKRARAGSTEVPFAVWRTRAKQRGSTASLTVLVSILLATVIGAVLSLVIFGRHVSWLRFIVTELFAFLYYQIALGVDVELTRQGKHVPFAVIGVAATVVAFLFALGGGGILA
jgi:steroid 5-alpha reductase family enzyme